MPIISEYDLAYYRARTVSGMSERHHRFTGKWGWHASTTPLEKLALIASEVGEAVNECRGAQPTAKLPAELADIVLRTFDLAKCLGIDLESELIAKMDVNDTRDLSHKVK